jgi:hypothetical protein
MARSSYSSLLSVCHESSSFPLSRLSHMVVLHYYGPKCKGVRWSWSETSETVIQNKPFLLCFHNVESSHEYTPSILVPKCVWVTALQHSYMEEFWNPIPLLQVCFSHNCLPRLSLFLVSLRFEVRVFSFQGRCFTTWAMLSRYFSKRTGLDILLFMFPK